MLGVALFEGGGTSVGTDGDADPIQILASLSDGAGRTGGGLVVAGHDVVDVNTGRGLWGRFFGRG